MHWCCLAVPNSLSPSLSFVCLDEGEDVVNVEFSLGYGGKILLHLARLWLKKGHRYGIVGKVHTHPTNLLLPHHNISRELLTTPPSLP